MQKIEPAKHSYPDLPEMLGLVKMHHCLGVKGFRGIFSSRCEAS